MSNVEILIYSYLAVGLFYALWVWLFKGATFFSIPVNAIFGPVYILGIIWHFWRWRKPSVHSLFKGKRAVVFDLDGTIVDDQPFWNQAIENVKQSVGLEKERNYPSGLNVRDKWANLLSNHVGEVRYSVDDLAKMTNEEFLRLYTGGDAHHGFWSFARYLKEKGFKLGLASNSDRWVVDEVLKRVEASDVFDATISGDEVPRFKPDPVIYREILKKLGVSAKSTVAFEDSVTGARSAVDAGVDTVVIWDGEVSKVEYPIGVKFFMDDFRGLDEQIEKSPKQILEEVAKEAEVVI